MDYRKEKCQVIQSWTFSELVGAFLDLVIAYLLLCGAATAYLASKFLVFFGLALPCPCNGLFWSPGPNRCLQKALVNSPSESVLAIQLSAKRKIPFDSTWTEDQNNIRVQSRDNVHAELEWEASSSSVTETREKSSVSRYATPKSASVVETKEKGSISRYATPIYETDEDLHLWNSPAMMEGRVYSKGKGVKTQRGRPALRRRGKKPAGGGKFSSVTSYDLLKLNSPDIPLPLFSLNMGSEKTEGSLEPVTSVDGSEAPKDIGWQERSLGDSELSETVDENKSAEKGAFTSEQEDLALDCNDKNMIRILEQALEEEHAVRNALYSELEKERIAAATATDEAMNMILRLQEEKAAVEMDARQYQRIIEAKAAYDAEEMNIMKEILVRREREKHFLEKEVEAYRQMYFGNEQLDTDILDFQAMQGECASLYSNEDPTLMLQGMSDSIDEKNKMKGATDFAERDELRSARGSTDNEVTFIEPNDHTLGLNEVVGSVRPQDINRQESVSTNTDIHIYNDLDFQEKGMVVSMEENPFTQHISTREPDLHNTCSDQGDMDSSSLVSTKESLLHDSHVIAGDDEVTSNEFSGIKGEQLSVDDSIYTPTYCDSPPMMRRLSSEHDRSRSSSEILSGFPPLGPSHGKASLSGSRRSSMSSLELKSYNDIPWLRTYGSEKGMGRTSTDLSSRLPPLGPSRGKTSSYDSRRRSLSALDNERLKLETEVKWFREKLKAVQKGREQLSISVECKDREKVQFKLLDDIASQLREIRQLTEPGKAAREVTLPPLSKVKSKKRRCRSASLDVSGNS